MIEEENKVAKSASANISATWVCQKKNEEQKQFTQFKVNSEFYIFRKIYFEIGVTKLIYTNYI